MPVRVLIVLVRCFFLYVPTTAFISVCVRVHLLHVLNEESICLPGEQKDEIREGRKGRGGT